MAASASARETEWLRRMLMDERVSENLLYDCFESTAYNEVQGALQVIKDVLAARQVSLPPASAAGLRGLLHNIRILAEDGAADDTSNRSFIATLLSRIAKHIPDRPTTPRLQLHVISAAAAVDAQAIAAPLRRIARLPLPPTLELMEDGVVQGIADDWAKGIEEVNAAWGVTWSSAAVFPAFIAHRLLDRATARHAPRPDRGEGREAATPPPQAQAGAALPHGTPARGVDSGGARPPATEASDRRCVAAALEVLTAMLPAWKTGAAATVTSAPPADADEEDPSRSTSFSGPGPGPWWAVLRRLLSAGLGGRLLPGGGGGGGGGAAALPPPPLPRDTIDVALSALGAVLDAYFCLLPLISELATPQPAIHYFISGEWIPAADLNALRDDAPSEAAAAASQALDRARESVAPARPGARATWVRDHRQDVKKWTLRLQERLPALFRPGDGGRGGGSGRGGGEFSGLLLECAEELSCAVGASEAASGAEVWQSLCDVSEHRFGPHHMSDGLLACLRAWDALLPPPLFQLPAAVLDGLHEGSVARSDAAPGSATRSDAHQLRGPPGSVGRAAPRSASQARGEASVSGRHRRLPADADLSPPSATHESTRPPAERAYATQAPESSSSLLLRPVSREAQDDNDDEMRGTREGASGSAGPSAPGASPACAARSRHPRSQEPVTQAPDSLPLARGGSDSDDPAADEGDGGGGGAAVVSSEEMVSPSPMAEFLQRHAAPVTAPAALAGSAVPSAAGTQPKSVKGSDDAESMFAVLRELQEESEAVALTGGGSGGGGGGGRSPAVAAVHGGASDGLWGGDDPVAAADAAADRHHRHLLLSPGFDDGRGFAADAAAATAAISTAPLGSFAGGGSSGGAGHSSMPPREEMGDNEDEEEVGDAEMADALTPPLVDAADDFTDPNQQQLPQSPTSPVLQPPLGARQVAAVAAAAAGGGLPSSLRTPQTAGPPEETQGIPPGQRSYFRTAGTAAPRTLALAAALSGGFAEAPSNARRTAEDFSLARGHGGAGDVTALTTLPLTGEGPPVPPGPHTPFVSGFSGGGYLDDTLLLRTGGGAGPQRGGGAGGAVGALPSASGVDPWQHEQPRQGCSLLDAGSSSGNSVPVSSLAEPANRSSLSGGESSSATLPLTTSGGSSSSSSAPADGSAGAASAALPLPSPTLVDAQAVHPVGAGASTTASFSSDSAELPPPLQPPRQLPAPALQQCGATDEKEDEDPQATAAAAANAASPGAEAARGSSSELGLLDRRIPVSSAANIAAAAAAATARFGEGAGGSPSSSMAPLASAATPVAQPLPSVSEGEASAALSRKSASAAATAAAVAAASAVLEAAYSASRGGVQVPRNAARLLALRPKLVQQLQQQHAAAGAAALAATTPGKAGAASGGVLAAAPPGSGASVRLPPTSGVKRGRESDPSAGVPQTAAWDGTGRSRFH